jgi:hypothetical protein
MALMLWLDGMMTMMVYACFAATLRVVFVVCMRDCLGDMESELAMRAICAQRRQVRNGLQCSEKALLGGGFFVSHCLTFELASALKGFLQGLHLAVWFEVLHGCNAFA